MYSLLIAAQPTVPIVLMVTEGDDAKQVDSEKCFYPALIERVETKISEFNIDGITVYGPRTYITHIEDSLKQALAGKGDKQNFLSENIKLAYAREEY